MEGVAGRVEAMSLACHMAVNQPLVGFCFAIVAFSPLLWPCAPSVNHMLSHFACHSVVATQLSLRDLPIPADPPPKLSHHTDPHK